MRTWTATVVLTFFGLISGFIASEPINATLALTDNALASSDVISQSPTRPITVSKAEFGVLRTDSQGQDSFTRTNRVILNQTGKYGWRIQLKGYKGEVTWREVLQLPKPPQTWATEDGENFSLSQDGIEAVTTRTQFTSDGVIENFWTIVPGDPSGKHRIQVFIDNLLVATFDFELISLRN
ncbi:hypothetical protein [Nostoc sp. CCY0012]|uniref:hypothetical protein n=1 Tax=Nostoc sp. CCY0012 TaxID=1056123 RepID=UPI0039C5CB2E